MKCLAVCVLRISLFLYLAVAAPTVGRGRTGAFKVGIAIDAESLKRGVP